MFQSASQLQSVSWGMMNDQVAQKKNGSGLRRGEGGVLATGTVLAAVALGLTFSGSV